MLRILTVLTVLLSLTLTGCSKTEAPNSVSIAITIKAGQVDPNGTSVSVAKGGTVTITVTSDADDEVHVHGYDKKIEAKAGKTVELTFTADQTGVFEIESHTLDKLIVKLTVR